MSTSTEEKASSAVRGLRAMFGCTYEALAIYRMALGSLLIIELVTRFRYIHPFYSDEGTLPLRLLLPQIDWLYKAVCVHTHLHELWQIQTVLGIQVLAAVLFTIGYQTKLMTILSWYLYLSLTLRNTWLNFILDRYFHFLLFYAMFLPCDQVWSLHSWLEDQQKDDDKQRTNKRRNELVVSPGTIALKSLVFWIYLDAGGGKYMDPLQGWTYNAKPLPALDTYTRHTTFARYVYGLMGPQGLRIMTPSVVYIELLAAPLALLGCFMGSASIVNFAIGLICQLHVGISLCINNAVLLSFVAIAVWAVYLPVGWDKVTSSSSTTTASGGSNASSIISTILVLGMVAGNFWFAFNSDSCDQVIFYSTIFHCRWNVFIGAEEYVTWEIAPGLLADNSIVDVWGRKEEVDWRLPGAGAPCTSTARPGRWRSFPYLAELEGEEGEVLWSYLCHQWDRENNVEQFPGRKLIKFNFFMLQADVLPNMGFSATRKRLIHSHECVKTSSAEEKVGQSTIEGESQSSDAAPDDGGTATEPEKEESDESAEEGAGSSSGDQAEEGKVDQEAANNVEQSTDESKEETTNEESAERVESGEEGGDNPGTDDGAIDGNGDDSPEVKDGTPDSGHTEEEEEEEEDTTRDEL